MGTSFDAIYNRLEPHIDAFESKRRALFSKGLRNGAITAGIIILVSLFFIQSLGFFLWIIIGLAIIIGITILNSQSGELCAYYKTHIVPPILNEVVPNVHYEPGMGISEETFCTCKLFPPPDRYSSEDFISGRVDKTDICFSEVHAEERHVSTTKNGTREYWTDIFRGFLFIADFHKDFSGRTILYRNSWFKFRFGSEKRVKLENSTFENCFDVFSTDEIEARYILSPAMMERLVEMNNRLGNNVTISFCHSNVYIAIPDSRNHFEASVWQPLTRRNLEEEFQTVSDLVQIVDELNLNLRIWTKE